MSLLKNSKGTLLMGVGYMLSPLSWWNDLFFNLPIAYGFAYLLHWLFTDSFFVLTIIGYWLSNVLGILMMQWGAFDLFWEERRSNVKRDVIIGFAGSTIYTVVVIVLLQFNLTELPDFLIQ
ncbi:UNVERIFIED_CONTAM: hypothetical protein BEN50_07410 [Euhalothece sp. KZN 001]